MKTAFADSADWVLHAADGHVLTVMSPCVLGTDHLWRFIGHRTSLRKRNPLKMTNRKSLRCKFLEAGRVSWEKNAKFCYSSFLALIPRQPLLVTANDKLDIFCEVVRLCLQYLSYLPKAGESVPLFAMGSCGFPTEAGLLRPANGPAPVSQPARTHISVC